MTFVFHLLVNCVQWRHVSEHWCKFCQLSIFLVFHLKSSPDFISWWQFQKSCSESILNWLTILQKQIIGIFINHFCLNRENVAKCPSIGGMSLIHTMYSHTFLKSVWRHSIISQGCNLYKLSQKCNLYKLLGDTFYNFQTFCLICNTGNTCMLSNFQSLFSSKSIDAQ